MLPEEVGAPVAAIFPDVAKVKLSVSCRVERNRPPAVLMTAPPPTTMLPLATTNTRPVEVKVPLIVAVSGVPRAPVLV